jgi:hypothetical protein
MKTVSLDTHVQEVVTRLNKTTAQLVTIVMEKHNFQKLVLQARSIDTSFNQVLKLVNRVFQAFIVREAAWVLHLIMSSFVAKDTTARQVPQTRKGKYPETLPSLALEFQSMSVPRVLIVPKAQRVLCRVLMDFTKIARGKKFVKLAQPALTVLAI